MGLDMFLWRDVYVGATWQHRKVTGKIELFADGKPIVIDLSKVDKVREQAGYWRNCWNIHAWFMSNVAEGEFPNSDWVGEKQIKALYQLCYDALNEYPEALAEFKVKYLDDDFRRELEYTISILSNILERDADFTFYYDASW